ncbi:probable cytochrome P450 312a1 [Drosophila eugracilis]|uniref:probable cytochrome P450 312a1 n=1 Tax=Drosophila eugracilis TaxID=29029 RepID=UPI0007E752F5|nr:probable cytochrome P450 312a1 [Drosophila eugracilis]
MFWLGFGFLLIALSLYLLYVFERQNRIDRLTHNWPGPPALPFIGHLHILAKLMGPHPIRRASEMIGDHLKDHRGKLWMGTKLYLVDCNPKDIQALCSAQQLLQKTNDYMVFENWLCEGLFTSNHEKWAHRRKIIMPAFNYAMVKQFVTIFEKQSRILLTNVAKYSESGEAMDFLNLVSCFTLDTICETALGVTVGAQSNAKSDYLEAVKEILVIMDTRLKNIVLRSSFIFKLTSHYKREKELVKILHGFTEGIIQKRLDEISQDAENFNTQSTKNEEMDEVKRTLSFLDSLLQAKGPDGNPWSVKDIREEVDTIIFGGYDLTATTLKFFMYNMTLYPEYQKRCREEVWSVCGRDKSEPISIEQVRQLQFIEACIKETLRMYPSGPLTARKATANCQINEFFIPKGCDVIISPIYMGRCKDFFPDPLVFKPDRWASGAKAKIEATTFIPFMAGARSCLGQRYSMVMLKIVLAHLLRNFLFEPLGERQVKMKLNFVITLHTVEPYLCKVKTID